MSATKKILIIDDEPLILSSMVIILSDLRAEITTAMNGAEGLAKLKEGTFDCVVSDINMPKMNGVELIKNVRGFDTALPFIFYSGHGNRDLMLEAAKYGAFDFLDKPALEGLEESVRRAIGKKDQNAEREFLSEYAKLVLSLQKN